MSCVSDGAPARRDSLASQIDCLGDICSSACASVADGRWSAELHNTVTNRDVPIYTKCSVYKRRTKASGTYRLYRAYAKPSDMTH